MPRSLFCSLLSMVLLASSCFALDPSLKISQYGHDAWTTDNGLPQSTIYAIVQSQDGYLWAATGEGLTRFDGIRFTVFDKNRVPEIRHNAILSLASANDGSLWIGTEGGGLIRLENRKFTAYTTEQGLSSNIITAIVQDRNGNVWIGTQDDGLNELLRNGNVIHYTVREGLAGNSIYALYEDTQGDLWIGTSKGLTCLRNGNFQTFRKEDGLAGDWVYSIVGDQQGNYWIGTGLGLSKLRHGRFESFPGQDALSKKTILSLKLDRQNNLWIGTLRYGLLRYHDGNVSALTTSEGLTDNVVLSLAEDREGNLWVGTSSGGLNRLKDSKFTNITTKEGLSNNIVLSIYQDRSGSIWIGTDGGGLNRLQGDKVSLLNAKERLFENVVFSIVEDNAGTLFIGTEKGLNRLEANALIPVKELAGRKIFSLATASDGGVWIGTNVGLSLLRQGELRTFTANDSLPHDWVFSIIEDRQGTIWAGTYQGLAAIRDGKVKTYTTRDGLPNNIIFSLYLDPQNILWIGTYGGGLARIKQNKISAFSVRGGLSDDTVFAIVEDDAGNLWMSCNKGVFQVSKRELEEYAEGKIKHLRSVLYNKGDGMKNQECTGAHQPAAWKTRDGKLLFATVEGVAIVDPYKRIANHYAPNVLVEEIMLDGSPVTMESRATFSPGARNLEFRYTALSFTDPRKVLFRYKLDGFDAEWIQADTRRIAYYTNLPPGHYTFQVTACNNDGVWNKSGARFAFYVQPHFYQTYTFYTLCFVAIVLVAVGLHRIQVKVHIAKSAVLMERNRISREIHDTLAQGFTGIIMQLQILQKITEHSQQDLRATEHLQKALTIAQSSLHEARRSIWALRLRDPSKEDLSKVVRSSAYQVIHDPSMELEVQTEGTPVDLSPETELNVLRVTQEAIMNAVKHANASRITVTLKYQEGALGIKISDNGNGFKMDGEEDSCNTGFGLISMRQRAEQLGGKLIISTQPGSGTVVDFWIPLK